MKAHLLYRDMDFSLKEPLPHNAEQLEHDLDLGTLDHPWRPETAGFTTSAGRP